MGDSLGSFAIVSPYHVALGRSCIPCHNRCVRITQFISHVGWQDRCHWVSHKAVWASYVVLALVEIRMRIPAKRAGEKPGFIRAERLPEMGAILLQRVGSLILHGKQQTLFLSGNNIVGRGFGGGVPGSVLTHTATASSHTDRCSNRRRTSSPALPSKEPRVSADST